MKKENDIQAELREWGSPLADMSRAMPFEVPEGYFENSAGDIYSSTENEGFIAGIDKMPFSIPGNYFEEFPQRMLDLVKAGEFETGLSKGMPYSVPERYFDVLPGAVLLQLNDKPAKKTVAFTPKFWMRQAIAAILIVAIGVSGYEFVTHRHSTPEKQLAKLPVTQVRQYLHQNTPDVELEPLNIAVADVNIVNATRQLDKKDIEQYLDETGVAESTIN